jgi:hypothetical protein
VFQCRENGGTSRFTSDLCPRAGGLGQNVYGDVAP